MIYYFEIKLWSFSSLIGVSDDLSNSNIYWHSFVQCATIKGGSSFESICFWNSLPSLPFSAVEGEGGVKRIWYVVDVSLIGLQTKLHIYHPPPLQWPNTNLSHILPHSSQPSSSPVMQLRRWDPEIPDWFKHRLEGGAQLLLSARHWRHTSANDSRGNTMMSHSCHITQLLHCHFVAKEFCTCWSFARLCGRSYGAVQ